MTTPSSPRPGDPSRLGPYVVLERLGHGTKGTVYLGQAEGGALVALRTIRPDWARDDEFRAWLRLAAHAARQVGRLCTAPVLEIQLDGDPPYLVTEYVDGPSLQAFVDENGPLATTALDGLAAATAAALMAMHAADVVHHDLKPTNVLLSRHGPWVVDVAIAKAFHSAVALGRTEPAATPGFLAPEQVLGTQVTAAADVFAWGGVIAFAATGRPPFGSGSPEDVSHRVVHEEPRLDGIPGHLRELVAAATRKEPKARPSARAVFEALTGGTAAGDPRAVVRQVLERTWGEVLGPAGTVSPSPAPNGPAPRSPADPAPAPVPEAAGPVPEAAGPVPEAGAPLPEAGAPLPEAGAPLPEAGAPLPEAGAPLPEPSAAGDAATQAIPAAATAAPADASRERAQWTQPLRVGALWRRHGGWPRRLLAFVAGLAVVLAALVVPGWRDIVDRVTAPRWQRLADLPIPVAAASVAAFQGRLWVAGGITTRDNQPQPVRDVQVYDPQAGRWTAGPSLPRPMSFAPLVSTGTALFLVGGLVADGSTATVLRLDPARGRWVEDTPLPSPRGAGAAAWDGSRLVFAGGVRRDHKAADDVWAMESGAWRPVGKLQRPREQLAAGTDGRGIVWFLAGRDPSLAGHQNLGAVDIVRGGSVRPAPQQVTPVHGPGAVWWPGTGICLVGGQLASGFSGRVECLDRQDRKGRPPPLPAPRAGLGTAVIGDVVYVVGGYGPGYWGTPRTESFR